VAGLATLGLVTVGLFVPGPHAPTASLSLSVDIGPPNIRTVVNGSGFGISEVVDISFDARVVAHATTDGAGSFSRKIHLPGQAVPGVHTVAALGEDSGITAETIFTVRMDWPAERFDPRGSAFNSLENVLSPQNVNGVVLKWKVALDICSLPLCPQPMVANGLLYATDPQGVHAFDATTGAPVWATNLNRDLVGVTATRDVLYVPSTGAHPAVWALDPLTGDVLWSSVIADVSGDLTRATVGAGTVFVCTKSGSTFVALEAATGAEMWRMTGAGRCSVPAIAGGVVYTHSRGTMLALDAATGAVVWQVAAGGISPRDEVTTVADGRVYALDYDGTVRAFDAGTGALDWSLDVGSDPGQSVAVADGMVFVGSFLDAHVTAIDADSGAITWISPSVGFFSEASPTVANGLVFMGAEPIGLGACGVCALDGRTGEIVWATYGGAQSPSYGSAFAVNGMVYTTYYETGEDISIPGGPPILAFGLP
jgi:outer membrane protein assembly factor BamB